jgi:excisionase family DNA binding protein
MTALERLRQIVTALPSDDSAVTFTRAGLVALLDAGDDGAVSPEAGPDLTVEEVGKETGRAPSTVRGWLNAGALRGYKLNGRDWRVPRAALVDYLSKQTEATDPSSETAEVDITAWRSVRRG